MAAPIMPNLGSKMKFSPIFTPAEMPVDIKHFFSSLFTIKMQLVKILATIAKKSAMDSTIRTVVPGRY